jgi:tRNA(fMet)-specific endonuclease VapC
LTLRYLLDTNIVSDLVRQLRGQCAKMVAQVGEIRVCTSIIVASELRYGASKKDSKRLTHQLEAVLGALKVLPFQAPADQAYGRLRAKLEAAGTPIGANDMLIVSHALALELTLVTDNEREFGRVEGLMIENWLR